jgi:phage replication initiation protein
MERPFANPIIHDGASANARMVAPATSAARAGALVGDVQASSNTNHATNYPRTVIRGESPQQENNRSQAALTDWLNVTFRFHPHDCTTDTFFTRFSEVTKGTFGGMTDQERGLHGWQYSFKFDRGSVVFAFGGQRYTAFLSLPGEGCSFISDWLSFSSFLRDELKARITRWDGAVDDFEGFHSVDEAVELYKSGGFNQGGRSPRPRQHGNWITPDTLGRTFEVGNRKNGKLIRIYEKGKQLGDPTSSWVRWEVELHANDRVIPWDVLLRPGDYVAGSYPCLSWVSGQALRIRTIKAQDDISYQRLIKAASTTYGPLINVMMQRENNAERVIEQLRRQAVPRRLEFTNDFLNNKGECNDV